MPPKRTKAKEVKLEPEVCRELYLVYDEVSKRQKMLYENMDQMHASAIIVYKKTLKNFCAKNPDIANMRLLDYLQYGNKIKSEQEDTSKLEVSEINLLEENIMDMGIDEEEDIEEVTVKKKKISDVIAAVNMDEDAKVTIKKEKISNLAAAIEMDENEEPTLPKKSIKKEKISTATAMETDEEEEPMPPKKSIKKEKFSNDAAAIEMDENEEPIPPKKSIKKEKISDAVKKKKSSAVKKDTEITPINEAKEEHMQLVLPNAIRPKKMAFRHAKPNEILFSASGTPVIVEPARELMRNLVISRPNFDISSIRVQKDEKGENLPEVD